VSPKSNNTTSLPRIVRQMRDAGEELVEQLGTQGASTGDHGAVARGGAIGTAMHTSGTEDPRDLADAIPLIERAFAFMDLSGFTRFTATYGEHAAIGALRTFRSLTRELTTRRGVRIGKWLGDGAMIVGVDTGPTIATAAELIARYDHQPLALRGGIAHGSVLIVDGDDYIGRPVNLAARLCQVAHPGELLAVGYPAASLPPWTRVVGTRSITLRGLGRIRRVQQLGLVADLDLPTLTPHAPPPS
jgi:adenylate cyclase